MRVFKWFNRRIIKVPRLICFFTLIWGKFFRWFWIFLLWSIISFLIVFSFDFILRRRLLSSLQILLWLNCFQINIMYFVISFNLRSRLLIIIIKIFLFLRLLFIWIKIIDVFKRHFDYRLYLFLCLGTHLFILFIRWQKKFLI